MEVVEDGGQLEAVRLTFIRRSSGFVCGVVAASLCPRSAETEMMNDGNAAVTTCGPL